MFAFSLLAFCQQRRPSTYHPRVDLAGCLRSASGNSFTYDADGNILTRKIRAGGTAVA